MSEGQPISIDVSLKSERQFTIDEVKSIVRYCISFPAYDSHDEVEHHTDMLLSHYTNNPEHQGLLQQAITEINSEGKFRLLDQFKTAATFTLGFNSLEALKFLVAFEPVNETEKTEYTHAKIASIHWFSDDEDVKKQLSSTYLNFLFDGLRNPDTAANALGTLSDLDPDAFLSYFWVVVGFHPGNDKILHQALSEVYQHSLSSNVSEGIHTIYDHILAVSRAIDEHPSIPDSLKK